MPCSHVFHDAVLAGWLVCTRCGMQATCKQCGRQSGLDVAALPHAFCARHQRAGVMIGFSLNDVGPHCIALAEQLGMWDGDELLVNLEYCQVRVVRHGNRYGVYVTPAGKTVPVFHATGTVSGCRLVYSGGSVGWVLPVLQCPQFVSDQVVRVGDVVFTS